jgi:type II secretory ATPase GspE/PulE/Tfp pilus assembly ATPase PilB-like protein
LLDQQVKDAIGAGMAEHELRELLCSMGTSSLAAEALNKASEGITSITEAMEISVV